MSMMLMEEEWTSWLTALSNGLDTRVLVVERSHESDRFYGMIAELSVNLNDDMRNG